MLGFRSLLNSHYWETRAIAATDAATMRQDAMSREFMPAMGHMTYRGISGTNGAVISGRLVRNVFKHFSVGHATEDRAAPVLRAAFSLLHFNPAPLFQRLYLIHF
jgi:RsiW-degrading membrane proteinase PrsW (M82 family)